MIIGHAAIEVGIIHVETAPESGLNLDPGTTYNYRESAPLIRLLRAAP